VGGGGGGKGGGVKESLPHCGWGKGRRIFEKLLIAISHSRCVDKGRRGWGEKKRPASTPKRRGKRSTGFTSFVTPKRFPASFLNRGKKNGTKWAGSSVRLGGGVGGGRGI